MMDAHRQAVPTGAEFHVAPPTSACMWLATAAARAGEIVALTPAVVRLWESCPPDCEQALVQQLGTVDPRALTLQEGCSPIPAQLLSIATGPTSQKHAVGTSLPSLTLGHTCPSLANVVLIVGHWWPKRFAVLCAVVALRDIAQGEVLRAVRSACGVECQACRHASKAVSLDAVVLGNDAVMSRIELQFTPITLQDVQEPLFIVDEQDERVAALLESGAAAGE